MSITKILVCPDSFKGSLTASEATDAIAEGIRAAGFRGEIIACPLSDGGEGISELIAADPLMKPVVVQTTDAIGRTISACYYIDSACCTAFIESASIIGLPQVPLSERNPIETTSAGLGTVIADAIDRKCRAVYVALGGSAVSDGGMGMLEALGARFYDVDGAELQGKGGNMRFIASADFTALKEKTEGVRFFAVSDVDNVLLGPEGAVYMFSPQKGAKPADLPLLEKGMENLVAIAESSGFNSIADAAMPGAGAAGGLGFALQSFMKADRLRGIDFVFEIVGFEKLIADADLVISGEGKLDVQSLKGKVVGGVLEKACQLAKPVIVFAGSIEDKEIMRGQRGLTVASEISDSQLPLEENMKRDVARRNLGNCVEKVMKDYFSDLESGRCTSSCGKGKLIP